jgi:hypothetical protein
VISSSNRTIGIYTLVGWGETVYIRRVEANELRSSTGGKATRYSPMGNSVPRSRSLISLLSMASILSTTSTSINVGCFAFINDDYVPSATPNLRWVLASHAPTRSTIADVNQWVGCASLLPTPSVVPHSQFNHASAREALKQQIKSFGAIRTSSTIKTSKCSYKVALKHAALHNTLTAAFATNHAQGREWLSLKFE